LLVTHLLIDGLSLITELSAVYCKALADNSRLCGRWCHIYIASGRDKEQ